MSQKRKAPASGSARGDSLEDLLKIGDNYTVAGLSDSVNASYAYTPDEWLTLAEDGLKHLMATGVPFSQIDLKPLVPEPDKPQRWGSFWAAARAMKLIEAIGWTEHRTSEKSDVQAIRLYVATRREAAA